MTTVDRPRRVDAARNAQTLLDAAARVFVEVGVDAPVREIATRAGVGIGTIYRHFPTRADLIVGVYQHQVDACVVAAPVLLAESASPIVALGEWANLFVDFLVTKHGLAAALNGDAYEVLHDSFINRLVPACEQIVVAARDAGELAPDVTAYEVLRAIGNLCIGDSSDARYVPRRMVAILIAGLKLPPG